MHSRYDSEYNLSRSRRSRNEQMRAAPTEYLYRNKDQRQIVDVIGRSRVDDQRYRSNVQDVLLNDFDQRKSHSRQMDDYLYDNQQSDARRNESLYHDRPHYDNRDMSEFDMFARRSPVSENKAYARGVNSRPPWETSSLFGNPKQDDDFDKRWNTRKRTLSPHMSRDITQKSITRAADYPAKFSRQSTRSFTDDYMIASPDRKYNITRAAVTPQSRTIGRNEKCKGVNRGKNFCVFCDQSGHLIDKCPKFLTLHVEIRNNIVRKIGLCPNCLSEECEPSMCSGLYCGICSTHHHTVLHIDAPMEQWPIQVRTPSDNRVTETLLGEFRRVTEQILAAQNQSQNVDYPYEAVTRQNSLHFTSQQDPQRFRESFPPRKTSKNSFGNFPARQPKSLLDHEFKKPQLFRRKQGQIRHKEQPRRRGITQTGRGNISRPGREGISRLGQGGISHLGQGGTSQPTTRRGKGGLQPIKKKDVMQKKRQGNQASTPRIKPCPASKKPKSNNVPNENKPQIQEKVVDKSEVKEKKRLEFEKFCKEQEICTDEEFDAFVESMKRDIPVILQLRSYPKPNATAFSIVVENMLSECSEKMYLPWFEDELVMQIPHLPGKQKALNSKNEFRLFRFIQDSEKLGHLRKTDVPTILSVHLLQVKSYHKVLDAMCAVSRTTHILENMQNDSLTGTPSGVLISNYPDKKVQHIWTKITMPNPCVMSTKHEINNFPDIILTNSEADTRSKLQFDRIMYMYSQSPHLGSAIRMDDLLINWDMMAAYTHYKNDKLGLKRCFEMLTNGGRLVFVRQSLNPIENEAVVYNALKEADGAIELMDVKSLVPGLKCAPVMTRWKPYSSDTNLFSSFEEVPIDLQNTITADLFPPSLEELEKFNFDRCIRVLPHYQDSVGYFVAVFHKVSSMPDEVKNESLAETEISERDSKIIKRGNVIKYKCALNTEMEFLDTADKLWSNLNNYWNFQSKKHGSVRPYLMESRRTPLSNIIMISKYVKDIFCNNASKLNIVHSGARVMFAERNVNYHLTVAGLLYLHPYLGPKRTLSVSKNDFLKMLFPHAENMIKVDKLDEDTQKRLNSVEIGHFVVELIEPIQIRVNCQKEKVGFIKINVDLAEKIYYLAILGEDMTWFNEKFEEERLMELEKKSLTAAKK